MPPDCDSSFQQRQAELSSLEAALPLLTLGLHRRGPEWGGVEVDCFVVAHPSPVLSVLMEKGFRFFPHIDSDF